MWIEAVRMRTRGMRWRDEEFIVFTAVCCGEKEKKGKYGDGVGDGFAEMMGKEANFRVFGARREGGSEGAFFQK